jgi:chromosome segregation ATPase
MPIPSMTGFFASIKFIVGGIFIVAIIGLAGALKLSHSKNETLSTQLESAEQAIESYKAAVLHLEEQAIKDRKSLQAVNSKMRDIDIENTELRKTITKARGKENVLEKKPSLVESRINTASQRMFDDISEATGYRPKASSSP